MADQFLGRMVSAGWQGRREGDPRHRHLPRIDTREVLVFINSHRVPRLLIMVEPINYEIATTLHTDLLSCVYIYGSAFLFTDIIGRTLLLLASFTYVFWGVGIDASA